MSKRISIVLISLVSFLGASYLPVRSVRTPSEQTGTPTVTPTLPPLTNFNKIISPDSYRDIGTPAGGAYPFGIKTVVIDAGHGGKDPGCLGITNIKEKDVALGIALKLGKYIEEKTPDVKVIYTRSTDIFPSLDERAAIANKNKADLFISIHCNTACSVNKKTKQKTCNEEIIGTETYVMGLHKTNANLNVAKRENEAILLEKNYSKRYDGFDPNSETGYILLTMQQNAYLKQSLNFAAKIQKQLKDKAGRADKGVQQAGFLVLWRTSMPSVLIETEFLSNASTEKFAGSEKGQDYMARSIFSAFRQYKDEVEGKLVKYDDEIETAAPFVPEKETKEKYNVEIKKNSEPVRKVSVIDVETKIEITPKDSSVEKNTMLPPVNDTMTKTPEVKEKKDSSGQSFPPSGETEGEAGIVYKIQFISSSQRIPLLSDRFKGLKDVEEYPDIFSYKYTAGEFETMNEAMKYRDEMQAKGYKDCFVVKYKNGKRMKNEK